ncbi:MAG: TetR/AcrR family transcriptional regulator [Actinomycetota bacterium]
MEVVTVVTEDNSARRPASNRGSHSHDDLAVALVNATANLVAEKGPAGFSLREVARRAGVSPAAPAHHFSNARGLLTAVAVQGFHYLDKTMADATVGVATPGERLVAIAAAYVDLGLRHPGHCAVMFRPDLVDRSDEAFLVESDRPYQRLRATMGELSEGLDPDLVDAATKTMWATLNGFVNLYISTADRLDDDPGLRQLVATAAGILHRGTIGSQT